MSPKKETNDSRLSPRYEVAKIALIVFVLIGFFVTGYALLQWIYSEPDILSSIAWFISDYVSYYWSVLAIMNFSIVLAFLILSILLFVELVRNRSWSYLLFCASGLICALLFIIPAVSSAFSGVFLFFNIFIFINYLGISLLSLACLRTIHPDYKGLLIRNIIISIISIGVIVCLLIVGGYLFYFNYDFLPHEFAITLESYSPKASPDETFSRPFNISMIKILFNGSNIIHAYRYEDDRYKSKELYCKEEFDLQNNAWKIVSWKNDFIENQSPPLKCNNMPFYKTRGEIIKAIRLGDLDKYEFNYDNVLDLSANVSLAQETVLPENFTLELLTEDWMRPSGSSYSNLFISFEKDKIVSVNRTLYGSGGGYGGGVYTNYCVERLNLTSNKWERIESKGYFLNQVKNPCNTFPIYLTRDAIIKAIEIRDLVPYRYRGFCNPYFCNNYLII